MMMGSVRPLVLSYQRTPPGLLAPGAGGACQGTQGRAWVQLADSEPEPPAYARAPGPPGALCARAAGPKAASTGVRVGSSELAGTAQQALARGRAAPWRAERLLVTLLTLLGF